MTHFFFKKIILQQTFRQPQFCLSTDKILNSFDLRLVYMFSIIYEWHYHTLQAESV